MASRTTDSLLSYQEKQLDELEQNFHRKLEQFGKQVKKTLRAASSHDTSSSFEKRKDKSLKLIEESVEQLSKRMNDVEEKQTKTQNKVKELSGKLCDCRKKIQDDLSEKLNDVHENIQKRLDSDLSKLKETTALNAQKILGLRKLWKLKPRTSQVTTATTSSASSLASASATATSPGRPIQSLSQRLSFTVGADSDNHAPNIVDLKLLPGGLVLVADGNNECVKLFNSQGQFMDSQTLDGKPRRIAVLNPTSTCDWDLALTLAGKYQIVFIKVTQQEISFKVRKHNETIRCTVSI
ncbi:hypothetical protein ElyMa_000868900 [Elysia marginata]|uniref:Uncharacterized protein n=1 Tax=Elysia marginata TaxID=1093978 RepID=A0AAV4H3K8_9GAST|nr:hypothetical protein ElyMa_000868900 [Elysia marginata]